jgi:hypothetical protein
VLGRQPSGLSIPTSLPLHFNSLHQLAGEDLLSAYLISEAMGSLHVVGNLARRN